MSLNKFTIQKSFAISAGAGSGKTYTLSRRYINALLGFDYFREDYASQNSNFQELKSAKVNQIVTLTYTEAAALEMKGRIFELISKILDLNLSSDDEDYASIYEANNNISKIEQEYLKTTLKKAYEDSSNSKISTIHSFCLNIIKSNSDIAKIDSTLDMIKDDEKQKEISIIVFEILNDKKNEDLILDITKDIGMFFINNLITKYINSSKFRNDFDNFDKNSIALLDYKKIMFELYPLIDIKEDFYFVKDYIEENLKEDAKKYLDFIDDYIKSVFNFEAKSWSELSKEHDVLIQFNRKPWTQHKSIKESIENIKALDSYVSIYSKIDEIKEELFFNKITKIKSLLHQIKSKYDKKLDELGKIDFDTILTKTAQILPRIQTDFKYIMVDEFQDTNELQFEIIKNARTKNTNLFVVGDSKQSIYSFQGAEIEVFNNAVENTTLFNSIEPMSQNYRSDTVILDTVNKIFAKLLKKDTHLQMISQNYEADAQDLYTKKQGGSFEYLVTSQAYKEEVNELDTIANFISEIARDKNSKYSHITKLISKKEKAIAIIFDSSTKMLELKQKLKSRGIIAKVSASDNFYHTKEINDIFNILKAIDILSRPLKDDKLNDFQRFYIVAALRSNILRFDDNSVKKYLDTNTIPSKLKEYIEVFKTKPLSQTVKFIYDDSNIFSLFSHFDDLEQRVANLYKFLLLCTEYENSDEQNLYNFLSLLENSIYLSEAKEDEAFYKSENSKSIEICSIHSTKGLAYPLVLLGNSDKALYGQIQSDALKHNNFTLNGVKKEIVGFKIGDYTPLSHRVLKQIDKLKHLAEKKRLLYVALTRAEHDVVISGKLKQNANASISLAKDSYFYMICNSLDIDIDELYGQGLEDAKNKLEEEIKVNKKEIEYISHSFKELKFKSKKQISATSDLNTININSKAAKLGTTIHEIIEFYWETFKDNQESILDKKSIFDEKDRMKIINNMNAFYKSHIYTLLKQNVEHHFELEFNYDDKTGFIDFIYFDKKQEAWVIVDFKTGKESEEKNADYQKQLDFYEMIMNDLGYKIANKQLLWLN